jgi:glycosidase
MKKDGEHFWLELTGLTENLEYGYQYLVDETIWIADPYADKILDPDDVWIPDSTYPNLKPYPQGALHEGWADNRVAVFQTAQQPYVWQVTDFQKPAKEDLIVYELLVRDFLGEQNMNYLALIDTLGYIQKLGVNVIELMPIMEFAGNDSWGYNPTFMFAVDKAYGTRNDLKAFIDAAHSRGIAVILDLVMNQNDMPSPYVKMYFDGKPTAENPWFNRDATHPFNVFFDINHESSYTQTWLDSINYYWLNEFKFDGFRFDLSKGFTQTNNPNDVGAWSSRDDSRIAILKRMADAIWSHSPDAYVTMEHLADNSEETILADYGIMLWGNAHWDYKDANLGFVDNNSLAWAYYKSRNWQNNNLIAYMESHDEQRQMFELINFGNSAGDYDIRNTETALNRLKMSAAFFFTVPGPKLFWQFGEFGYDVDIDQNGRTGRKPTKWQYLDDPDKRKVHEVYTELIGLRHKYDVFTKGDFTWSPSGGLKSIHITNGDTSVVILGNFGVTPRTMNPSFQHTGSWYDFFKGTAIDVTDVNAAVSLGPGQFHIYTDKQLHTPESDLILGIEENTFGRLNVYPNPASDKIVVDIAEGVGKFSLNIIDLSGRMVYSQDKQLLSSENRVEVDISDLQTGVFVVEFISRKYKLSNLIYKK